MFKAKLVISGHVQGVFYRQSMKAEATSLGLVGWVRNLKDGTVEAEVFGARENIEALISWCKTGPPHAKVQQVDLNWLAFENDLVFKSFEVRSV